MNIRTITVSTLTVSSPEHMGSNPLEVRLLPESK